MAAPGAQTASQLSKQVVRFGLFEVDLASGELRKQGVRLHLQTKPFHVLRALLEKPGEVVSREDLHKQLWREDTFVDFERGLNTAVNRLRIALGDNAETPRYVETLARVGYRFVAPVARHSSPVPLAAKPEVKSKLQLRVGAAATAAVL